jgi:hypothetical protein
MNKIWFSLVVSLCFVQAQGAVSKRENKKYFLRKQINQCMQILMQKLHQAGKNIENKKIRKEIFSACLDWKRHGHNPVEVAQQIEI